MWLEASLGCPRVTITVHIQAAVYRSVVSVEVFLWSSSSVCVFMYAWLCLCVKVGQSDHRASLRAAWTSDSWAQTDPNPSSSILLRFRRVRHGTDGWLAMINDKPWIEVGWRRSRVTIRSGNSSWLMYLAAVLKDWLIVGLLFMFWAEWLQMPRMNGHG